MNPHNLYGQKSFIIGQGREATRISVPPETWDLILAGVAATPRSVEPTVRMVLRTLALIRSSTGRTLVLRRSKKNKRAIDGAPYLEALGDEICVELLHEAVKSQAIEHAQTRRVMQTRPQTREHSGRPTAQHRG